MKRLSGWWRETFTLHRWALNPFQMYGISFLLAAAIAQMQLGATPGGVFADHLDYQTIRALAVANTVGGCIALFGLHLRELESALWVEFCGYLVLVFVLGLYVFLVTTNQLNPNASYGFALAESFMWAAVHRSIQILLYKRARRRRMRLACEAHALQQALENILPQVPVEGEEGL